MTSGGQQASPDSSPGTRFPVHKAARVTLAVLRGANLTDALAATGIPRLTWYQWLQVGTNGQRYDDLPVSTDLVTFAARCKHAFERAQGLCAMRSQRLLLQAAKSSVGTLDWRAAHEHLKHAEATRARWHEYRELKVTQGGTVSHEHLLVERASRDQLIEALPAEFRELLPGPDRA